MVELIRDYVIPLRREVRKAPKWRRSKKAVSVVRKFIQKHMKTEKVIVCTELNEKIWEHGIKNPPGKVEVSVAKIKKDEDVFSIVNLKEVGLQEYIKLYETDKVKEKIKKLEKEGKEEAEKKENTDVEKENEGKSEEVDKGKKETDESKDEEKESAKKEKKIKDNKKEESSNEDKKKEEKKK